MKKINTIVAAMVIILMFAHCKQVYDPQIAAANTRLLVVEGFINSGAGSTTIRLSRTGDFKDTAIRPELGSQVNIEGGDGSKFALAGNANGEYSISQLTLINSVKYRLHIRTTNGKEYISAYTPVRYTPPIDSISWQRENDGVQIYVNTHDDQNSTKYYLWTYTETWEFHSPYLSYLDWQRDPVTHDVTDLMGRMNTDSIYKCWKTQNSTNLLLGSSEKLGIDKIFLPIRYIEPMSEELSVRYYIELRQYALSHEAYLFYQKLKKNTEELGSLFDPQPSELQGNIRCATDPNESVIGYVEVSKEEKANIFIANSEVAPWVPSPNCPKKIIYNDPDSMRSYVSDYIPLQGVTYRGLAIVTFSAAPSLCVDCTLRGTNLKPSFWP